MIQHGKELEEELTEAARRVAGEAPRKAIHLASIVIPLGILHAPLGVTRRVLVLVGVGFLIFDLMRIHHPKLRTYFGVFFGSIIRLHETRGVMGSTYLLISALLVTWLFDVHTAAAALIYLIVGDTFAAMIGKAWGRTKLFGKSLEGFAGGFLVSFAAVAFLVPEIPLEVLLAGALAASVVEILPLPVDDNFRIPLVAGVVIQSLM
ncbi:MAG: phosphatidate cytidylyltransferase [Gemmatimonadota bacterium]|nr:phosphatidate cytidylyltransferase [Gemmatimonadota bacterium]MDP6530238.1 phosphatidate cytidylyltransferase [Gemmatimonadota bacterium]MDP6801924.1 phosphatidate cytidylyltransferase [Gemmatimonadota bacterium]MDP7032345.1 phosphatidate cytidylyltransferase [Gemmatimonadota bacterium]